MSMLLRVYNNGGRFINLYKIAEYRCSKVRKYGIGKNKYNNFPVNSRSKDDYGVDVGIGSFSTVTRLDAPSRNGVTINRQALKRCLKGVKC